MFRRGPDDIPRGSGLLMIKVIALDKRQQLYDRVCEFIEKPAGAYQFLQDYADRTDGKPTQRHEVTTPRTTVFKKDPDAAPPPVQGPGGSPVPVEGVLVDEQGQAFESVRR